MSWHHFEDTKPKARKTHCCEICNESIEPGEIHVSRRGTWDGRFLAVRMHEDCEIFTRQWSQMEWECHLPGDFTRQDVTRANERGLFNAAPDQTADQGEKI